MLSNSYPGLFGWIDCRKECWQHQSVVEVVKYFAASFDYLSTRHCLWSKPGGIFYTFIYEGRVLPTLQGLDPMTHKGKDHMVASNSFVLGRCNGIKKAFYLAATRSST